MLFFLYTRKNNKHVITEMAILRRILMKQKYIIGLDIGTTSTKATIFTLEGRFVSSKSVEYPTFYPKVDWVEQDPDMIYQAVLDAVRDSILKAKKNKKFRTYRNWN